MLIFRFSFLSLATSHSFLSELDTTVFDALVNMYRNEGLRGYFKGNGTNCIKVVPASAIRFVSFENYKRLLKKDADTPLNTAQRLLSGSTAGVTAVVATYARALCRRRRSVLAVHVCCTAAVPHHFFVFW